jgi:hypothetical protein
VPVVSDPYATHPEDKNYYPTLTPGLYKEASSGRLFIYKPTFGVKNPIRHYTKVNSPYYPNVHRPLTEEEEKRAVIEKQLTLEKYKKPEVIEDDSKVPTLQWLCLKAIQTKKCSTIICGEEYKTTIKNFRLIFEDSLVHRLGIEEHLWPIGPGIDDQCPQPCRYNGGNQVIKHICEGWYNTPPYITQYISFRYQDWIEAGGLELRDKLNGPRFWIDLWSEEALKFCTYPASDNHPRQLLLSKWFEDHNKQEGTFKIDEIGWLATKRIRLIHKKETLKKP